MFCGLEHWRIMTLHRKKHIAHLTLMDPAHGLFLQILGCFEWYTHYCYETAWNNETKWNVETWWEEHSDINKTSEPPRHLKNNPMHAFTWKVLMTVPINDCVRKNLEVSFIALSRPLPNEQIDSKKLLLFQNCVTWQFHSFKL